MKKVLAIALATVLVFAMSVPAFAVTMSQQQETDPHTKQQNYNGKSVDFILVDEDGNPIEGLEYSDDGTKLIADSKELGEEVTYEAIMVPYHNKDNAPTAEIKTALENAYAAAQNGALDELAGGKVLKSLVYIGLKRTTQAGNVSYVGITDIDVEGVNALKLEFDDGYSLAIDMSGTLYVKSAEGSYVLFSEDGVFALFKDKSTGSGDGTSPQTGYESNNGIFVASALVATLVAIVGVCYIVDKKRA